MLQLRMRLLRTAAAVLLLVAACGGSHGRSEIPGTDAGGSRDAGDDARPSTDGADDVPHPPVDGGVADTADAAADTEAPADASLGADTADVAPSCPGQVLWSRPFAASSATADGDGNFYAWAS